MANSIVFQNSAEQLKTSIYGYDSTTSSYKALKVNSDGELYVIAGTINYIGTIKYVDQIGTLKYVAPIGTLKYVNQLGTLKYVAPIGTLKYVNQLGTLKAVVGTVKVNLVDRIFTSSTQTINVGTSASIYSDLINISKYVDTSWYLRNITPTVSRTAVTVELAATPSNNLTTYPLTLVQETATLNGSPHLITNDRYARYISAKIKNASSFSTQTVVIVFNGRY